MKREFQFQEGEVLLINKPLHWTSFQLVNKLRWLIKNKLKVKKIKVGHAGTLDPLATGLMIICTGKKTKEIDQYQATEKEYIATIKLGATTPSYDGEKAEDCFYPIQHITEELIREKVQSFLGEIQQIPPIFSALKVGGKKMYEQARKGKEVEIKARTIFIKEIEIQKIEIPYIRLRIVCSKGTYIRFLAYDIGKALGSGAWLSSLIRTKVGTSSLENSLDIQGFEEIIRKV